MGYFPKNSKISAKEVAALLNCEAIGNQSACFDAISPTGQTSENCLSICTKKNCKQILKEAEKCAGLIILDSTKPEITQELPDKVFFFVQDPIAAIRSIIPLFYETKLPEPDTHSTAQIDPSAKIDPSVRVGAFSIISANCTIEAGTVIESRVSIGEGSTLGKNCYIHSGAVIRERTKIGQKVSIQSNATIGSDGFGYTPSPTGLQAVPQVGRVVLEDFVDVGANTCIDRGALGDTIISQGTKIDNQVQIGHNVKIGMHSIVCGQVGIAGSCNIGNQVVIAGDVGIADHLTIVDGVRIAGGSCVTSSLLEKGDYSGYPAFPSHEWRKQIVSFRKLPQFFKNLRSKNNSIK